MWCTIPVSVLLSPLCSLMSSWLQTGEDIDSNQKLSWVIVNLGTSTGKSLTMCLNLLLNHGQKSRQRTQVEQYIYWESLCWGLWCLNCVCTPVIRLTFNIYKKSSMIYWSEVVLRGSVETWSSSQQQTSAESAAGLSCRRGECDRGTDIFILLTHLIEKELTVFYPGVNTIYWAICDWTNPILYASMSSQNSCFSFL